MTVARVISGILRRPVSIRTTVSSAADFNLLRYPTTSPFFSNPVRSFAFSPAEEEEAAERRRANRRNAPRSRRDPNLPDTPRVLGGHRLNLHNRVQSLIRAGDLDNASVVARHSVFSSPRPTVFTCNAIIGGMHRAKRYSDAIALFVYFFKQSNVIPNIVSYNYLIVSHCENREVDKALEVYQHIKENAPFIPSAVTFRHLTKGLVDAGRIDEAVRLLWRMVGDGYGTDSHVFNNIISGFLNSNNLSKANEFFDELKSRCTVYDGIVNATFMEWFFSKGKPKEAMDSYKSLLNEEFEMTPDTCNVLLSVLLKWGKKPEAEALFDSMLERHNPPAFHGLNSETYNLLVDDCFKKGKVSEVYSVFSKRIGKGNNSGFFEIDIGGYNNLIMRYCENDMLNDAENMYTRLCSRNPYFSEVNDNTYKILIEANFESGRIDEAMEKFMKMTDDRFRVIPSNFANKWFLKLIENGKIVECEAILTKMGESDPKPDARSYEIVIRALCGVCDYEKSLCLLQQMSTYGVGVTPSLKECVLVEFEKVGRKQEIEQYIK